MVGDLAKDGFERSPTFIALEFAGARNCRISLMTNATVNQLVLDLNRR